MGLKICFMGIDGSGKSTIAKEIALKINAKRVYFGWKPFLPTTKVISWFFRKRDYKIAESMNKKKQKFSLLQDVMLVYYYFEYLARYFFKIAFSRKIVIDRYFYDMYAHYDYASRSKIFRFLIKIFPKPDYIFFLDIDLLEAKKRKPEMDIGLLKMHRQKYLELSRIVKMKRIDTSKRIDECIVEIMGGIR